MEKLKILVIDDDEVAQALIGKVLAMGGYSQVVTGSSQEAIRLLRSGTWACVILELGIQGTGGLELLELIKRENPDLPVIVVTDDQKVETAVAAMRFHAANYLVKPVMPRDILINIQDALAQDQKRSRKEKASASPSAAEWQITPGINLSETFRRLTTRLKTVPLTMLETKVLRILASSKGKIVSPDQIVAEAQGYAMTSQDAAQIIRPTISRLNKKLALCQDKAVQIVNVRGAGYYLRSEETKNPD